MLLSCGTCVILGGVGFGSVSPGVSHPNNQKFQSKVRWCKETKKNKLKRQQQRGQMAGLGTKWLSTAFQVLVLIKLLEHSTVACSYDRASLSGTEGRLYQIL